MRSTFDSWHRRCPIDGRILIAFFALTAVSLTFIKIASEVVEGETLAFDRWLLLALRSSADSSVPIGPLWLQIMVRDVTALGSTTVLALLTIIAGGYLVSARKASTALLLLAAISSGLIVSSLLKFSFARARPEVVSHLVQVSTTSFPSGHAMNSAITYLTLGALLARAEASRAVRAYVLAVSIGLTVMIGFSRIYLGVHWPSDVVAGWCMGAAWAMLWSFAAWTLQRRRTV